MGFKMNKAQLQSAFIRFKDLADKKKEVFEEDLMSIVEEQMKDVPEVWSLVGLDFFGGIGVEPKATVWLKKSKKILTRATRIDMILRPSDGSTGRQKGR